MKNHGNPQPTWLDSFDNDTSRLLLKWGWRLALIAIAMVWMLLIGSSWSQAAQPADTKSDQPAAAADRSPASAPASRRGPAAEGDQAAASGSDGEYSFKWLDPDKKIYVLQNRRYTKANRALISLMAGPGFSNTYRNTIAIDGRLAYYFSEVWGLEGFYSHVSNSSNSAYNALSSSDPNGTSLIKPIVREIKDQYGALLHWVPWYAKINVFNNILYFDWYFAGGVGSMDSTVDIGALGHPAPVSQTNIAYYLGTGHQYSLGQNFIARLDLTGSFFREPLYGTTGENQWYSNYNFEIGFGVRL